MFVNTDYSLNVTSGFEGVPTAGRFTAVQTSVPSDKSIVGQHFAVYSTPNKHTHKKKKEKKKVLDLRKERFGEKKVDVICDNVQHEFKFPKYLLKNVLDWAF